MAINYSIHTDLDLADLRARLNVAARTAAGLWETWTASDELGRFHEEIMAEYGIDRGFRSLVFTRHSKRRSVEAREKLMRFFESLPGRKLVLRDDTFVDYQDA